MGSGDMILAELAKKFKKNLSKQVQKAMKTEKEITQQDIVAVGVASYMEGFKNAQTLIGKNKI